MFLIRKQNGMAMIKAQATAEGKISFRKNAKLIGLLNSLSVTYDTKSLIRTETVAAMLAENIMPGFRNPLIHDIDIAATDRDSAENPKILPTNRSCISPTAKPVTPLAGHGLIHPAAHAKAIAKSGPLALPRYTYWISRTRGANNRHITNRPISLLVI
jgi:hypothetical protein